MKEPGISKRKRHTGTVVSDKMDNTVIVSVSRTISHSRYGKVMKRTKKYYAHSEDQTIKAGDTVVITETRPLSKLKRWRVEQKLEA